VNRSTATYNITIVAPSRLAPATIVDLFAALTPFGHVSAINAYDNGYAVASEPQPAPAPAAEAPKAEAKAEPAPAAEPKRGRGRPRKDEAAASTTVEIPAVPQEWPKAAVRVKVADNAINKDNSFWAARIGKVGTLRPDAYFVADGEKEGVTGGRSDRFEPAIPADDLDELDAAAPADGPSELDELDELDAEPAPAPAPVKVTPEMRDEMRKLINLHAKTVSATATRAILAKYGATNASTVADEHVPAVMAELVA
jgi:hypothetical protein